MATVDLKGVTKSYDGKLSVIHGIDLHIRHGEFVVFVGPSGCGKSTLLRMVAGLEPITGGEVRIGEKVVNALPPRQRDIAMVFQDYALYPHKSLFENMAFGLRLRKTPEADIQRRVMEAAKLLRIDHMLERRPAALSGGQRQRVAIGRAIVREPGVFLLDEPLSNLDAALRVQTRFEIAKIHRDFGRASTVYVTHDQVEAMTLADRILLLNAGEAVALEGSVAQCGAPLELYHRPRNLFVAGFIGSPKMNFMPATLVSANARTARVRLAGGEQIDAAVDAQGQPAGAPLTIGIRPEDVRVGNVTQPLVREVQWQERLGETTYLYLRTGVETDPFVVKASGNLHATEGQRVAISLPAESLHVFDAKGLALSRCVQDSDLPVPQAA